MRKTVDWELRLRSSQVLTNWADRQKTLFSKLHDLPSVDWIADFVSEKPSLRIAAHEQYSAAIENLATDGEDDVRMIAAQGFWEALSRDLSVFPDSPTALIAMRCAIYRIFGDVDETTALTKTRSAVNTLSEDNQVRKYTGPILRRFHNAVGSDTLLTGSKYEKQRKLIQGCVKHARSMFDSLSLCLENDQIRENLFDVPRKYFEKEFLEDIIGDIPETKVPISGKSLFEDFPKIPERANNIDTYEMVDFSSRLKK